LHCHDWQTALACAYLEYRLSPAAATVMTIHNLLFQGVFSANTLAELDLPAEALNVDRLEFHGRLSFLKAGLVLADAITTVSPTYAREVMTTAFGCGLDGVLRQRAPDVTGILNGIDEQIWCPHADSHIACPYDVQHLQRKAHNKLALQQRLGLQLDATAPLLAVVSRLTHQKGLDLLIEIGDQLAARGAQLALLGSGERSMQDAFIALAERHQNRFSVVVGYDEALAHQIEAGGDIFLMPSRFEPCGLNEMYSLHYGTPPVVRATGGLADTVIDTNAETIASGTANGFVFGDITAATFLATIDRAIAAWRDKALWRKIQRTGMTTDFSWAHAAARYQALYERLSAAQ
jgi:starch synthase